MHLFLSWSGGRSHRLAQTLKDWLEQHFRGDGITAFVSSEIDKGSQWLPIVSKQLQAADAGVVCLTRQSLGSDWLLFEAGALATSVAFRHGEERIFTYLLDLPPSALSGPLAAYQSTVANREDTLRFVNGLRDLLKLSRLAPSEFDSAWKDLHQRLEGIEAQAVDEVFPELPQLFDRKTFTEPIAECLDQSWFRRHEGAILARDKLDAKADLVRSECGQFAADLYSDLRAQVDSYAMDLRALLFTPKVFDLTDEGRRAVPKGVEAALERSRTAVHTRLAQLTDPRQHARVRDAFRFERAASFADRMAIIHALENEMEATDAHDTRAAHDRLLLINSEWTLDRIRGYLLSERQCIADDYTRAARAVRRELERIQESAAPVTLIALGYGLRWLKSTVDVAPPADPESARRLATEVRALLERRGLDQGGQLRSILTDVQNLLPDIDKTDRPSVD